jgi:acyl transferase domain-containing protein/ubiquinone/menaquinone biosynthesis C-methylase UbiE/acyl carrier protein
MTAVEPIAIIGIGCRMPGGVRDPDDLWTLLASGVDAITEVPKERWNVSTVFHPDSSKPGRTCTRWGGYMDEIDRFDAQFFGITPREASAADPQQRLLLETAYEAIEDAGLNLAALAGTHTGVHIGISAYDYGALQLISNERVAIDGYTNLGLALSIVANRLSYFFNLVGPSLVIDTACSSSLVAAHLACQCIWNGESELEFVGGVNVHLMPEVTIGFSKASMLAPDGRCKAFDARADGFVRSEGVAVAILKPLARALADRNRIYAVIRGTAVNQDGRTDGLTVPNPISQEANIISALRLADITPESVQYVEAHGTGTPVGDPIEATAIGRVYGAAQRPGHQCVIGSIKSNLGHLESTSGIAGLLKAALCLKHRQIPANLHFEQPNPQIPFDELRLRVPQRLEPWPETFGQPPRAGVNSFGFGGTNAHVILEAPPQPQTVAPAQAPASLCAELVDRRAWMLPLSARSERALSDLARSYLKALPDERGLKNAALRDICFSATAKRSHHEFRLALVGHDKAELVEQIEAFLNREERPNSSVGRASGNSVRPVFVCSGMGQQWWAMGRELMTEEPVYRQAVEEFCDCFAEISDFSLLNEIMADEKSSQIQQTHIGQPSIFALQVGLAALWRSWGVEPAAVFGHSAGELAASYISGALSLEDAVLVGYHRSRLQRRLAGQGAMLAAGISRAEAARLVERHSLDISIAAINGPSSVTLSGDASVLAEIDKTLNETGLFSRPLQVEVPFHSPKVDELRVELLQCLSGIRPRPASTPFFSTVTGTMLRGSELDAKYWYANMREPVLFSDTMAALIKSGHRVFLELGAHPILRYDIRECFKEHAAQGTTLCSLRRQDRERAALLGSFGRMYTLGASIDWGKLFPADAADVKLPSYPFQRETYWREADWSRRKRLGEIVHPLLGERSDTPEPCWNVQIDTADLGYLVDHRRGKAIIFPGAGYVEMALAAAQEIFGPVPCVIEDIEFQKMLVVDEKAARPMQVIFDRSSSEFNIYARAEGSDSDWDLHARGSVRQLSQPALPAVDLKEIRRRCSDSLDRTEFFRLFADMGFHYGPSFQGIAHLWRRDGEALAEIRVPDDVGEKLNDYRLHPAVLDACFQTTSAAAPMNFASGEAYLPVKIERVRFHASLPTRLFACAQLRTLGPRAFKVDIQILDEAGNRLVEILGLVPRLAGQRTQTLKPALYEYQWKLSPRPGTRATRDSYHLPALEVLAPVLQQESEILQQRLDRTRYQNEFSREERAVAAAYITHALRELGWIPELSETLQTEALADRLGIAPQYRRWLRLMLKELSPEELAATEQPQCWKRLWESFPECQVEMMLCRLFGEKLPSLLRGEIDPLNLLFPEGALTFSEHLYQDSAALRINNLLIQKSVAKIVQQLPRGKALRILEVGAGTGGTTSFVLPILSQHCTQYVFTDVSTHFLAQAQHKFARYPFVEFRILDIERDPLEQGFNEHSFDLIIASNVLHATQDLRRTIERVKQLLGSGGTLLLLEPTQPGLGAHLTFGLLPGWWFFEDRELRPEQPCLSQHKWKSLLRQAGFEATICLADCPDADTAQNSVILARGPRLPVSSIPAHTPVQPKQWLVFADRGAAGRSSAGAQLALQLRKRGDRVIEVKCGTEFREYDEAAFTIRAGNSEDMQRLINGVCKEASRLAGVVHLWSLDIETSDATTNDEVMESARLGCIGALHLMQALASTDNIAIDGVWFVTRAAQQIENGATTLEVLQSPLWGLGRVAISEYQHLHCRLIDLASCSQEEIVSFAEELNTPDEAEDEIVLHGELRYVHRLVPVSPSTVHGMGRRIGAVQKPFRIEISRLGILDSLTAHAIARKPLKPTEIQIEVLAAGLIFKDMMEVMGTYPREELADDPRSLTIGMERVGRVIGIGSAVSEIAVGDEVIAAGTGSLGSRFVVDQQFVFPKPRHLTFEEAATIPVAFLTAWYSLHTLAQMQPGDRVLIHSATGGVGLAAVQLARKAGAEVFATAGTEEKRKLLAALGVSHVMDSRSLAFADEVLELTEGEGVDIVLNSLAGEAIDKSLSILRPFGRFVEIGKTDIYRNRKIGMWPLRKNISVFVVDLNAFEQRPGLFRAVLRDVMAQFEERQLQPLPYRVFPVTRMADAFRYMAQGKHIGKLIISMQDSAGLRIDEDLHPVAIDPDAAYLITGGLGGFGLAVADRLARNGARRLALVGRRSPSASAQAVVQSLRERGVEVMICQADIAEREQARKALELIQRSMGPLRGVIHAAMVLDDALIERLSEEQMWKAMAPKMMGAWNLHVLTADAQLEFFVLFSSFASIIGNAGQANYAAGNAFLDSLAYYRRALGRPGITVNWGAIGEVGHVANSQEASQATARLGGKAMPISETLDALDELISSDAVQVALALIDWEQLIMRATGARVPGRFAALIGQTGAEEDRSAVGSRVRDVLDASGAARTALLETYLLDALARAMQASPSQIDTVQSLPNLGLDSLIAVELRSRINEDFGINVPLAKFKQGASVKTLALYIGEQLPEGDRGGDAGSIADEIAAESEDIPLSGEDPADLLERIDEMTDEEVDRRLSVLAPQGHA